MSIVFTALPHHAFGRRAIIHLSALAQSLVSCHDGVCIKDIIRKENKDGQDTGRSGEGQGRLQAVDTLRSDLADMSDPRLPSLAIAAEQPPREGKV